MGLVHKLRRLMFGRSLAQILVPTGVFVLAVYFMMFSSTVGKRSSFSKKIFHFIDSFGDHTNQEYCNPTSITRRAVSKMNRSTVSCKPHVASETACKLAKELYYTNPELKTCGYSRPVEICKRLGSSPNEVSAFKCSLKDCKKYKRGNMLVWSTLSSSGRLEKSEYFKREADLQNSIDKIVANSRKAGLSFLIFECTDSKDYKRAAHDFIGQFFFIPPIASTKNKQKEDRKININMVMIDSAARSHFYRSLPKTISTFSKINKYRHIKAEILDFELFQSIEGHTAENLHGLFTGKLFPKSFTGEEREKSAIGVGDFLKIFKSNGYKTIYQDDLCFDEFWGMRLDLGTPNSWGEFLKAKAENHIESTGRWSFSSSVTLTY